MWTRQAFLPHLSTAAHAFGTYKLHNCMLILKGSCLQYLQCCSVAIHPGASPSLCLRRSSACHSMCGTVCRLRRGSKPIYPSYFPFPKALQAKLKMFPLSHPGQLILPLLPSIQVLMAASTSLAGTLDIRHVHLLHGLCSSFPLIFASLISLHCRLKCNLSGMVNPAPNYFRG